WAPILENRANCPRSARIIAHHRPESPPTIIQNDCPRWARIRIWERCQERAQNHAHPEQKTRTIWAVFQEEKALLRPFQATFDG
ncbi:hypothetical protein, partial [Acidithiobacillus thiooxidans]|uniref:hypothetical protein n=1 Tax=Acidithiobacillus thiooxidans TaxID=930 RepID=UPI0013151003